MQVSRAVVNGGLAELAKQGFLEVRPRQGTCVADYRRKGNLGTLIAIMEYQGGVLGKDEIRSILEVRRALEHLARSARSAMHPMRRFRQLGEIVARLKDAQTLHRLRKLHSPSSMSWHFPAEPAFSHSSTIHLKRRSLRFGCAFAGFMALKLCITTRKRCIAAFAPAMNRLRRSGQRLFGASH